MDEANAQLIERYQKLYEEDPHSRIFAPLAEGYRKMGLLKEALQLAQDGVKKHPEFSGGRVALGKILLDLGQLEKSEKEFRKASELTPENIMAHQMMGEILLRLKKPKEALRAYKMLLFLAPENEKAGRAVKKLEALTAEDYDEDMFAMKPLPQAVEEWNQIQLEEPNPVAIDAQNARKTKYLERTLGLVDAYIVRNDVDRALVTLNEAESLWGSDPEIVKRLRLIHHRHMETIPHPKTSQELNIQLSNQLGARPAAPLRQPTELDNKIEFLQDLLNRIKERSRSYS